MIDPNKPIRFVDGNTRVRIVGRVATDFTIRFHDGKEWKTAKITKDGSHVKYGHESRIPQVENYDLDWDRPLAFQDTAERGHLAYFPGTEEQYGVQAGDGTLYWFTPTGEPICRKDGKEIQARQIMNVETAYTRQADARRRIIEKKLAREQDEANPLWGIF